MRILVVEDEKKTASFVRKALQAESFAVDVVHNGTDGLAAAITGAFDAVVLDIMLPGRDGLSVLRQLRAHKNSTPVLLLSARGEVNERVEGLNAGADDYLPKPFNPRELLARMRAILRRSTPAPKPEQTVLRAETLELNRAARAVTLGGTKVELTDVEFALLEVLMRSPGNVVSREEMSETVLGRKFHPFDRSLDMHVSRLRRKLVDAGGSEEQVKTIRGAGYQLAINFETNVAGD